MDECKGDKHDCDPNANCTNNYGSYKCTCMEGYTGMGIHVRVNFPLLIKKMKALASLFPVFLLFFLACFRLLAKFSSVFLSSIFFIPCFL